MKPTPTAHPASLAAAESSLQLRLVRTFFRALHRLAPNAALALATRAASRARRHRRPPAERTLLARASRLRVDAGDGHELAVWRFGASPRRVLLVHGWEGRGAQLGALVDPLLDLGMEVVLFDHIGHGESAGRGSSLIKFCDGVQAVARELGPFEGCVAHSMGAMAVTLALSRGTAFERLVYFSPPWDLSRHVERFIWLFTGVHGLAGRVLERFQEHYGVRAEQVSMGTLVVGRCEPLLVLHDLLDQDVPLHEGRLVAERWPGSGFRETSGLGHRRILRDRGAAGRAAAFLAASSRA